MYAEFVEFKCLKHSELFPTGLLDDIVVREYEDCPNENRIDTIWYHIQKMGSLVAISKWFPLLFKVARLAMTCNSNADIEMVFSLLNKNKSQQRNRNHIDIEDSLSSILSVKMARPESVSNF